MGCDFDLTFIANSTAQADGYFTQASKMAQKYEKRFSRFDVDSELSILNDKKSLRVSDEFLNVYWVAYRIYKQTQGKFNPLMQVANVGYDKSFEKIDNDNSSQLENLDYDTNLDNVSIVKNQIILQETQKLDFGGFLKGYVTQKIAHSIKSDGGIIINIGGDMYVRGSDKDKNKFVVEVAHPADESKNISFPIINKSLCTSGVYRRKWTIDKSKKHHILDINTKDSAQTDVVSASVLHNKGAIADAFATVAVTLGMDRAENFLTKQNGVDFVLIDVNGDIITS